MANNVIDELSLNISANASSAISNLSRLQGNLRNIAKSLGTASSATSAFNKSFAGLNSINLSKINAISESLERLDKVHLKNLSGKTIKINIQMSGASEAERRAIAINDALNSINTQKLARDFSSSIGIVGDDAKKLQKVFADMAVDISKGGDGRTALFKWMSDAEKTDFKLDSSGFKQSTDEIKTAYTDLYNYLNRVKIHVPDGTNLKAFFESVDVKRGGYRNLFSTTGGMGIDQLVNGDLTDATKSFAGYTQQLKGLINSKDQIETLMETMRKMRETISQPVTLKSLDNASQDDFWSNLIQQAETAPQKVQAAFNREMNKSMKESANAIPLDIKIDANRIKQQIQAAIAEATQKPFELPVEFALNTRALNSTISSTLGKVDSSSIGNLSEQLNSAARAFQDIGSINPKESGMTSFVNSMTRLASVDMSKFDGGALGGVLDLIKGISGMGDISAGVNRLVSSLARLANAGGSIGNVKENIVPLGQALREVVRGFSSSGGIAAIFGKGFNGTINNTINQFVSSLAQLSNAGDKTGKTASQLGVLSQAIIEFMQSMQNAPMISNNVLSMMQSLGQIASAGASAGSAAKSLNKNMNGTSHASSRAAAGFSLVGDALRALEPAYNRVTTASRNLIKSGFQRITSGLDPSKLIAPFNNLGSAVNGVTANVKTLLTTMIGFRGITGIFSGLKNSIMQGADVTEIDHIIESVFTKDMVGYVHEWSHTAIEEFGIAENAAKRMAGTLSAMFQASKIGQNDAGKMGMDLTGLAGDLSAFYNIDTETAFNKIRSGMAGMVRPLRKQHCAFAQKCA